MKVKVAVKYAPLNQVGYFLNQALTETQADLAAALAEQEQLLQEKRDAERKAVCAERDYDNMKRRYADAQAENDNLQTAYQQMQAALSKAIRDLNEVKQQAEDELADYRMELADRNERIIQLEQRIEWLDDEVKRGHAHVGSLKNELAATREDLDIAQTALASYTECGTEMAEQKAFIKELQAEVKHLMNVEDECLKYREINERRKARIAELEEQLTNAHMTIESQQKTITDAGETISNLRRQCQSAPTAEEIFRHFFGSLMQE